MKTAKWSRETWVEEPQQETAVLAGGQGGSGLGLQAGQHLVLPGEPGKRGGHSRAGVELAAVRSKAGSAFRELGAEAHLTGGEEGLPTGQGEEGSNREKGW